MADRDEVKALLARAGVEINNALHRVDEMSPSELDDVVKMKGDLAAQFFDKNGSCAKPTTSDLAAVFDKNGSCSSPTNTLDAAFRRVLKPNA